MRESDAGRAAHGRGQCRSDDRSRLRDAARRRRRPSPARVLLPRVRRPRPQTLTDAKSSASPAPARAREAVRDTDSVRTSSPCRGPSPAPATRTWAAARRVRALRVHVEERRQAHDRDGGRHSMEERRAASSARRATRRSRLRTETAPVWVGPSGTTTSSAVPRHPSRTPVTVTLEKRSRSREGRRAGESRRRLSTPSGPGHPVPRCGRQRGVWEITASRPAGGR
jgi:hypothetical protein